MKKIKFFVKSTFSLVYEVYCIPVTVWIKEKYCIFKVVSEIKLYYAFGHDSPDFRLKKK